MLLSIKKLIQTNICTTFLRPNNLTECYANIAILVSTILKIVQICY